MQRVCLTCWLIQQCYGAKSLLGISRPRGPQKRPFWWRAALARKMVGEEIYIQHKVPLDGCQVLLKRVIRKLFTKVTCKGVQTYHTTR